MWLVSDWLMDALHSAVIWIFIMDLVILCPHHSLSSESMKVSDPWPKFICISGLHGHILLDLGHFASSNHYYSNWDIKCLVVCSTVWGSGKLYINCVPCYHIIVIFHSLFPHVRTAHPTSLNIHFRVIITRCRQHVHFYSKACIFLLLFFHDSQPLRPFAYLPWPGQNYSWLTIRLTMWHICIFCPWLILHVRCCWVTHPCITLLWFHADSFRIATVSTTPIIIVLLHV